MARLVGGIDPQHLSNEYICRIAHILGMLITYFGICFPQMHSLYHKIVRATKYHKPTMIIVVDQLPEANVTRR